MASEESKYKNLPRAANGIAPAYWNEKEKEWLPYEGGANLVEELNNIKATQDKILERLDKPLDTQLIGSNVEDEESLPTRPSSKQELEVLVDAEIIEANSDSGNVYMNPKGASEIYLFVQIDGQPWTLDYRNQFGSVSYENGFPVLNRVEETYGRAVPAMSFPIGYKPSQGIPAPSTMKEAKDWGIPITSDEYFKVRNFSSENATATVSILRVWR